MVSFTATKNCVHTVYLPYSYCTYMLLLPLFLSEVTHTRAHAYAHTHNQFLGKGLSLFLLYISLEISIEICFILRQ